MCGLKAACHLLANYERPALDAAIDEALLASIRERETVLRTLTTPDVRIPLLVLGTEQACPENGSREQDQSGSNDACSACSQNGRMIG